MLALPPYLGQDYEQNGFCEKRGRVRWNRLSDCRMGEWCGARVGKASTPWLVGQSEHSMHLVFIHWPLSIVDFGLLWHHTASPPITAGTHTGHCVQLVLYCRGCHFWFFWVWAPHESQHYSICTRYWPLSFLGVGLLCCHTASPLIRKVYPPKNGEIALLLTTNGLMCSKYVTPKRNEAIDNCQWYKMLLNFML